MQLNFLYHLIYLARYYLYLVGVIYIIIGLGALAELYKSLWQIFLYPFYLGILVTFVGMTPLRFIDVVGTVGTEDLSPHFPWLGILAVFLGMVSLIALNKINQNARWIYVWWILVFIAIIMGVDNFIGGVVEEEVWLFPFTYLIHPVLLLFAVYLVNIGIKSRQYVIHSAD